MPARCVRLTESEANSLEAAANYRGLSVNDFMYAAIDRFVARARRDHRRGRPHGPPRIREPRPGQRRHPLGIPMSEGYYRALHSHLSTRLERADFVRNALKAEIAQPTTNVDPDSGSREYSFQVMLTDDERNALDEARAPREISRALFARVAIWRAMYPDGTIEGGVDRPESLPSGNAPGSRLDAERDPSRPDTTHAR